MTGWRALPIMTAMFAAGCAPLPGTPGMLSGGPVAANEHAASTAADIAQVVRTEAGSGFSGTVLVGTSDRVLLAEGYGKANGHRIGSADRFWIASLGKPFAAAAVMSLVADGKVGLDDTLGRFFAGIPADKAPITVRQLLSHNSGFGQSYVAERQANRETAVRLMLAEPLAGAPGSGFRYSNSNFQLAAAIVEVVSGQPYAQFVRRRLWRPAGLQATGFAGDPSSTTVMPTSGELPERLRHRYWGEQGIYSTAPDLYRWYRSLTRGGVIDPALVREMFQPVVKTGEGHATLGWFRGRTPAGNEFIFMRGNEDFGANALLYAYPAKDLVVIVLTHTGQAGEDLSWSRKVLTRIEAQLGL